MSWIENVIILNDEMINYATLYGMAKGGSTFKSFNSPIKWCLKSVDSPLSGAFKLAISPLNRRCLQIGELSFMGLITLFAFKLFTVPFK